MEEKGYVLVMTVEALKQEIEHLPEAEQTALVAWLARKDSGAWDRQMERDFSEGGAGMDLIAAWDAEIQSGQSSGVNPLRSRLTLSFRKLYAQLPPDIRRIASEKYRVARRLDDDLYWVRIGSHEDYNNVLKRLK